MLHFNCTIREGRSLLPTARPDLNHLCTQPDAQVCANCKAQVTCINSEAYAYSCQDGYFCHEIESGVWATCKDADAEGCNCPVDKNDFIKDHYSDTNFIYCPEDTFELYECAEGTTFNTDNENCASNNPECTQNGIFVNKDDCSKYYKCTAVTGTNK